MSMYNYIAKIPIAISFLLDCNRLRCSQIDGKTYFSDKAGRIGNFINFKILSIFMSRKIFLVLFSILCILLIGCSQKGIIAAQQAQNPDSAKVKCDYDDNGCNKEGVMCKVSPPLAIKL